MSKDGAVMRADKRSDPTGDLLDIDRSKQANRDMPDNIRWMWSVIGTIDDGNASGEDCLDEFRKALTIGQISHGMCSSILSDCAHRRPDLFKELCRIIAES